MKTLARTLTLFAMIALFACGAPQGGGDDSARPIEVTPADDLAQVVADAPSGAILDLADGTYVVAMPLQIDKAMTLRGSDPSKVRIVNAPSDLQTQQLGEGPTVVSVSAGGFSASGITFAYEGTLDANVVTVRDASVDIDDCVFSGGVRTQVTVDSETYLGVGLDLLGSITGTVSNSLFTMNDGDGLRAAGTFPSPSSETKLRTTRSASPSRTMRRQRCRATTQVATPVGGSSTSRTVEARRRGTRSVTTPSRA